MQRRPLSQLFNFPLTSGLLLGSIGWTIADIAAPGVWRTLTLNYTIFSSEPWRALSWIFPHGDLIHLFFNAYWIWLFGSSFEDRFGTSRSALLVVISALASGFITLAFSGPGAIGMSGVLYAYFGFMAVARRTNYSLRNIMDEGTERVLGIWFFIAIALTELNIMNVANWAHGGGLAVGAAMGLVAANKKGLQALGYIATALFIVIPAVFIMQGLRII